MVYLQARTHHGVCDPGRLGPLPAIWEQALGAGDVTRLDDLFARLIWAPDGDNTALDRYAHEYREIIGPPAPPPDGQAGQEPRASQPSASAGAGQETDCEREQSLGEALTQALSDQRDGQFEQLNEDIDLQELLKSATGAEPRGRTGRGTGRPSGRLPDRGVNRPPMADEVLMARQYARRLRQAREWA